MKVDAKCIHCSVKLEVGENFLESQAKIKKYWCTTCKQTHNKSRMWVNGKYISFDHPLHKQGDTSPLMMQPLLPWREI
jgi:hypothetical protein